MTKILIDEAVVRQALEYLQDNQHLIADNERHAYVMEYNDFIERFEQAIADAEKQPAPPECQTEAEKTAFAFGWYKALESVREQPLPFGVGGGLVAIKTLLSRDPCAHANVAIKMIDAMLAEQPAQDAERQISQLIQERDHRDEIIDKLCDAVLGSDRYEWSSQYFFEDAVREVEERMAALEPPAQQELVAIEYWLQDTMESGRWVTTDNMARATAEKMLSGEYGDVYPQGRIVESSPPAQPAREPLTDEQIAIIASTPCAVVGSYVHTFARAIEAAHGITKGGAA